jgi:hypothetical protein
MLINHKNKKLNKCLKVFLKYYNNWNALMKTDKYLKKNNFCSVHLNNEIKKYDYKMKRVYKVIEKSLYERK